MTARLILAIFSTLLEEAALVAIVLWGLPQLGIHIPLPGLIAIMVAWGAGSIIIYRMGSRALKRKPVVGLPTMIGGKAKVVSPLVPEGMVKMKGELWMAQSTEGTVDAGEVVIVVSQDALKLIVRKGSPGDLKRTK